MRQAPDRRPCARPSGHRAPSHGLQSSSSGGLIRRKSRQGGGRREVGIGFWPGVRACGEALFEKTSLHFSGLSQGEVNAPVSLSDDPFVLTGRPITPAGRIGPTSAGAAQKRVCVWADSPLNFLTCSRGGRASAQVKRAAARPILSGQVFRKL